MCIFGEIISKVNIISDGWAEKVTETLQMLLVSMMSVVSYMVSMNTETSTKTKTDISLFRQQIFLHEL